MNKIFSTTLFSLFVVSLYANDIKTISALRIDHAIKIDGKLDEIGWSNAMVAKDFIQTEPIVGKKATFDTDAYFLYDDNAIYIGARMYDDDPSKILKELSVRDQIGNADNFRLFIDPYKSGLNGFKFHVTASGVQYEANVSNHKDDANWNAVWDSEVSFDEKGWYVEIRIPYASLRFPQQDVQSWGLQISREIRRFRELSNWSPIDPAIDGWVQQSGLLQDIQDIKTPTRLSFTPYISSYINSEYKPNDKDKFSLTNAYNAGLDLKYGINDAFTLDMTLIPDFGQVISDRQVLNLSPFEVFFEENRQFFTEGTELFNKGRLFYSRRIGDRPINYYSAFASVGQNERLLENPTNTQLINATKISGRNAKGVGVGVFNAVVGESYATIQDTLSDTQRQLMTSPLTNYNSIVIDKNLKNNSYISFINTNVMRRGTVYDANVTGVFTTLRTVDQKYAITGNAAVSQRYYSERADIGHTYNLSLGKVSGNWTYNLSHGVESDRYNPNDFGFLFAANKVYYSMTGGYAQYKPLRPKLQQYTYAGEVTFRQLYRPNVFTDYYMTARTFYLYKSRFAFGGDMRIDPVSNRDYFEPRTTDFSKYLALPTSFSVGGFVSSDYRKPFAYDIRTSFKKFNSIGRSNATILMSPRFRFNDRFSAQISSSISFLTFDQGYVNKNLVGEAIEGLQDSDILMGNRNRQIVENTLSGKYSFNSKMNIAIRVRHYWDKVIYQSFGRLTDSGILDILSYRGFDGTGKSLFDRNVNIFNIDLQYNWRFAPGSDIIVVWKNQISQSDAAYQRDYFSNLGNLFTSEQGNNLSLRVIYFLDYQSLKPNRKIKEI